MHQTYSRKLLCNCFELASYITWVSITSFKLIVTGDLCALRPFSNKWLVCCCFFHALLPANFRIQTIKLNSVLSTTLPVTRHGAQIKTMKPNESRLAIFSFQSWKKGSQLKSRLEPNVIFNWPSRSKAPFSLESSLSHFRPRVPWSQRVFLIFFGLRWESREAARKTSGTRVDHVVFSCEFF